MPRKLRAIMALTGAGAGASGGVQRHKQAAASAPPPAAALAGDSRKPPSAPLPVAAPAAAPAAEPAVRKEKRPAYESRRVRRKRALREAEEAAAVALPPRPAFGDVVDAPPSITLKLKRADLLRAGGGDGSRLGRLFEQQLSAPSRGAAEPPSRERRVRGKGLKRPADFAHRHRGDAPQTMPMASALPPPKRPRV